MCSQEKSTKKVKEAETNSIENQGKKEDKTPGEVEERSEPTAEGSLEGIGGCRKEGRKEGAR